MVASDANDEGRALPQIDELGGDDADDARGPAGLAQDDRRAGISIAEELEGLAVDLILHGAARLVGGLDDGGALGGGDGVGQEHGQRRLGGPQPAGGVEARRQLPGDQLLIDDGVGGDLHGGEERGDAGAAARRQAQEAVVDQDAVLVGERDQIGDGAEGDEVEELADVGLGARVGEVAGLAQGGAHRAGDVEGEAHRGQAAEREARVVAEGVDEGVRGVRGDGIPDGLGGRRRRHGVVIDDDDVDVALAGDGDGVEVAGAAIAGDDELGAAVQEGGGHLGREAVALIAVRHRRLDAGADRAEEAGEQRRGGHAVDVVVAEDADDLPRP